MAFFYIFIFMSEKNVFKSILEIIKTFVIGIFVGIANVIPGVSGGTIAVVFNIYDKLVNAITINLKKLFKNWKFVLPILFGMAAGILLFSKVLTKLIANYPEQTNFFFIGLIVGSIPLLSKYTFQKNIKKDESESEELKNNEAASVEKIPSFAKYLILSIEILIGIGIIILFQYLHVKYGDGNTQTEVLPEISLKLVLKLFAGGMLGAFAMIIPGISGSLIMLILDIYTVIIAAVAGLMSKGTFIHSCMILFPAGIGILVGLFAGAKLISVLIRKIPNYTYAIILGLIIGSVFVMIPLKLENSSIVIDILIMGIGFCLAFFSTLFSGKNESKEQMDCEKTSGEEIKS